MAADPGDLSLGGGSIMLKIPRNMKASPSKKISDNPVVSNGKQNVANLTTSKENNSKSNSPSTTSFSTSGAIPNVITELVSGGVPSKSNIDNGSEVVTSFSSEKSSIASLKRLALVDTKGDDNSCRYHNKNTNDIASDEQKLEELFNGDAKNTREDSTLSAKASKDSNESTWHSWARRSSQKEPTEEAPSWYSYFFKPSQQSSSQQPELVQPSEQVVTNATKTEVTMDTDNNNSDDNKDNTITSESQQSNTPQGQSSGSSWAFWSRNSGTGELAVSGTPSENHPREASRPEIDGNKVQQPVRKSPSKKERKVVRPNLVEPSTNISYPLYSRSQYLRSTLRQFSEYMVPSLKNAQKTVLHPHLYRTAPAKIKKVVVIGVHGYFPARVFRTIMGEPTGTSIKFANEAENAVKKWAVEKGFKIETEKIALDGEGKVLYRVEHLYKLLLNWTKLIETADFVFFVAHSQGTPVAVHLMAKLIEDGYVKKQRLALLGMAGISLGPISGLDQKLVLRAITPFENDSLRELFEFQKINSEQSQAYLNSLRTILSHNAKITFVGSMNDQLVPLYSATCCHISHPNIYRAVYIDGQDVSPEFISNLISMALRLENYGSTDHGTIKQLSGALTGTLTGGGHSKIYDESRVYDLALRYALETTDAPTSTSLQVDSEFQIPKPNQNPYLLPWCLRGLLAEAQIRPSFEEQLNELYEEFENWRPESKILKDIKYRISAIKHSKL